MSENENVLGFLVYSAGVESCVRNIVGSFQEKGVCRWMACLNPYAYELARKDSLFEQALKDADWLVPDGVGILIADRLLKGAMKGRITGSDIFEKVQRGLDLAGGKSVFFLGASEETLSVIKEFMRRDYPRLKVGTYSPPFKSEFSNEDLEAMMKAVNDAAPDVLWVGMTAPKQEKWIFQNRHRLNARFAGAVGAVFDYYAGRVKRAHPILRRMGLEWAVRFFKEPRRVWPRVFWAGPLFIWHVFLAMHGGAKTRS